VNLVIVYLLLVLSSRIFAQAIFHNTVQHQIQIVWDIHTNLAKIRNDLPSVTWRARTCCSASCLTGSSGERRLTITSWRACRTGLEESDILTQTLFKTRADFQTFRRIICRTKRRGLYKIRVTFNNYLCKILKKYSNDFSTWKFFRKHTKTDVTAWCDFKVRKEKICAKNRHKKLQKQFYSSYCKIIKLNSIIQKNIYVYDKLYVS
jgi:hypothetical protein